MKIHFVKAGETLYKIGIKYGVTIEELVAANKSIIDPNLIMEGMKLVIPMKQTPEQTPVQTIEQSSLHAPVQIPVETQTPVQMQNQGFAPVDSTAPTIPLYPANEHMPAQMPVQAMLPNQNMPATQSAPANQYPAYLPEYPGLAVQPFATIPIPAHQVTAPIAMPMPNPAPTWGMPVEYTTYNTPYHMTNYTVPNSYPNSSPSPNLAYQGMAQANGNYQPYSSNMMPYPSHENYEYYNTYSTLQNNAAWPSHNSQPHAQMAQVQIAPDHDQAEPVMQQEANESIGDQKDNKRLRTSTSSKGNVTTRTKKNTLHDQVMKLQQTRNRR